MFDEDEAGFSCPIITVCMEQYLVHRHMDHRYLFSIDSFRRGV